MICRTKNSARPLNFLTALVILRCLGLVDGIAQPVTVTLKLDQAQVLPDQTTTLHVFAQIASNAPPSATGIFSWYIDLLTLSEGVVLIDYGQLKRPTSDNNVHTSSPGVTDGLNQLGIYDTFLNLPHAGQGAPVELVSVPVTGFGIGTATFRVRAGTQVPQLSADFLVSNSASDAPLVGADYSSAVIALDVLRAPGGVGNCKPTVTIAVASLATGKPQVTISFQPCPSSDHFVEFADQIGGAWTALPGAPHNSGTATDTPAARTRYYRVRIQ